VDIRTLQSQHDIVDLIGQVVPLKQHGQRYTGICPLHKDTIPSLVVYPHQQSFHCFGCGAHGNIFNWLMLTLNIDFKTACNLLNNLPEQTFEPLFKPKFKQFRTVSRASAEYWHNRLGKKREYFQRRGFTDETIDREAWGWDGCRFVLTIWEGKPQESRLLAVKLRRDDELEKRKLAENGLVGKQTDEVLRLIPKYILKGSYSPILYNAWAIENCSAPLIFFGEFDAALATQLGCPACSPNQGAKSWDDSWNRDYFRHCERIKIIPDRGEREQAFRVRASLGGQAEVVELPMGPWKDFTDFILAGHNIQELENGMS